jgi:hypothetical protein
VSNGTLQLEGQRWACRLMPTVSLKNWERWSRISQSFRPWFSCRWNYCRHHLGSGALSDWVIEWYAVNVSTVPKVMQHYDRKTRILHVGGCILGKSLRARYKTHEGCTLKPTMLRRSPERYLKDFESKVR